MSLARTNNPELSKACTVLTDDQCISLLGCANSHNNILYFVIKKALLVELSDNKIHHYFNEVINEHYKLKLIPEDHLKKFLYNKTFVEKIQDHVLTLSEEEDAEKIDQALSVFLSHSNIQTRKFIVEGHETHKNDIADKIKYDIFEKAKTKINDLCLTEQQKEEEQLGKDIKHANKGSIQVCKKYQ